MFIRKIRVSNFKSFDEMDIELDKFNILIGANASGKSNFIDIIKFIKDMVENGLESAIFMHGGVEFVRNIKRGASKNLSIEFHIDSRDQPFRFGFTGSKKEIIIEIYEYMYKIGIKFTQRRRNYRVVEEKFEAIGNFFEKKIKKQEKEIEGISFTIGSSEENIEVDRTKKGKIIVFREKNKIKFKFTPFDGSIDDENMLSLFHGILTEKLTSKESFTENPMVFPPMYLLIRSFSDIHIYDIDPRLSKNAIPITGKTELEADGGNLAVVLEYIQDKKENIERFSLLLRDLLPFIEEVKVEKRWAQKFLLITLKETAYGEYLPAFLLSDGTLSITALIIILYFEKNPLVIIEEPERNVHPYLISKIAEMMKDVSATLKKQIIVTTHNPEIVRYAGIENILLVQRDNEGFSKISKPCKKDEVKIFLENEMDIEELYVQNLLEW